MAPTLQRKLIGILISSLLAAGAARALGALESYRRAVAAVERAVGALGGSGGVITLGHVAFTLEATAIALVQSPRPDPPYLEVPVSLEVDAAPDQRWASVTTVTTLPEGTVRTRRMLGPRGAFEADLESGVTGPAAFGWEAFERDFRRSPHLVLRDAWERRSHLRWLGSESIDGVICDLVHFPFLGRQGLTLAIDPEGRVLRHEFVFDDLRSGDAVVSARFLDYRRRGGTWIPGRLRQTEAGRPGMEGTYTRYDLGDEPTPEAYSPPSAPPESRDSPPAANEADPGIPEPAALEELADGIYRIRRLEGNDYHSLLVDLGPHLLVVEAPLGQVAATEILRAARRLAPGKPIRYVVATHHHADHAGGVPYLVAETGAAVVTTRGNADFFTAAIAAPRTLATPPISAGGNAEVIVMEGREWRAPGERALVVYDAGPTAHAVEILVAWAPGAGILFQGDFVNFRPDGGVEEVRPQAARLIEFLAERGLEPERIVGVHGGIGTVEELRRAVAERPTP